jgi:hypothetical protein
MTSTHRELAVAVTRLAIEGADERDLVEAAMAAKKAITEENMALIRSLNLIDQAVFFRTQSPTWQWGWYQFPNPATATANQPAQMTKADRPTQVREIATRLAGEASGVVKVAQVVEVMRQKGDQTQPRNLATAVGNILYRSSGWEREGPATYRLSTVRKEGE